MTNPTAYKSITIAGKKLAYIDQGQGFPVLLGHSYLWDANMWRPQIDALSEHFRVIAPDLWGHGLSDSPPAGTDSIQTLARHHIALLDALGIDECHVVGLSVGGMWAEALAQLAPERVRGLVLMDTYVGKEPVLSAARYMGMFAQIERDQTISAPLLNTVVPMFFSPGIDAESALYTEFRASLAAVSPQRLLDSIVPLGRVIFGRDDFRHRLHLLDPANTLVMVGENDIPRPMEEAAEMAKLIGCPLHTIERAGHISNLENPRAVTRALLDFLTRRG